MFFSHLSSRDDYYPARFETRHALGEMDFALEQIARNHDTIEIARTASDIERIHRSGKIAAVLDIEGSFDLDGDLDVLRDMYRLGLRSAQLSAHNYHQQLRRFLLLAREMAWSERPRPRLYPRDEPAGDGDQRLPRVR